MQANIITDLDTKSASLQDQMTHKFDDTWCKFWNNQLRQSNRLHKKKPPAYLHCLLDWHACINTAQIDALDNIQAKADSEIQKLDNTSNPVIEKVQATQLHWNQSTRPSRIKQGLPKTKKPASSLSPNQPKYWKSYTTCTGNCSKTSYMSMEMNSPTKYRFQHSAHPL
jgi:hypothetical protein